MYTYGEGKVMTEMLVSTIWKAVKLTKALYNPNSHQNLLSSGSVLDKGITNQKLVIKVSYFFDLISPSPIEDKTSQELWFGKYSVSKHLRKFRTNVL